MCAMSMKFRFALIALPLLSTALAGCGVSTFTERATDPLMAIDIDGDYKAVATKAERRLVLTAPNPSPKLKGYRTVCAEPSPDAAEAVFADFRAGLEASEKSGSKVNAEFARTLATSVGALTRRSQGLQYFRDGVFALCQGSMSGIALENPRVIIEQFIALRNDAKEMIKAEVAQDNWNALPEITIQTAPVPPQEKPENDAREAKTTTTTTTQTN